MRVHVFGTVVDLRAPSSTIKQTCLLAAVFFMVSTFFFISKLKDETSESTYAARKIKKVPEDSYDILTGPKGGLGFADTLFNPADIMNQMGKGKRQEPIDPLKQRMAMHVLSQKARAKLKETWDDILKHQQRPSDKVYNINVTLSDRISFDRAIPDSRPVVCAEKVYDYTFLGTASVIMIFNNEALSMLLRAVHSILNRTPDKLLKEIILVDDHSDNVNLKEPLDRYVNQLPKVRLLRTRSRVGLIKARMLGAEQAEGDVLIFQDAHTENNNVWLEPLLDELRKHPNAVLQPSVDGVEKDNIQYVYGKTVHVGAFSWSLTYKWLALPDHEAQEIWDTGRSFWTPILVGCIIAVRKQYFFELGGFDSDLKIWGGENIELSFRAWQCGGLVETVPCSRVGHVFKQFYNRFGKDESILQKNSMRVAEVWMDGMKKYFYGCSRVYEFNRVNFTKEEWSSVQRRRDLRKRLQCKNFEWYMHNVLPRLEIPPMEARWYGEVMNTDTQGCFEMKPDYYVGITYNCFVHRIMPQNFFHLTENGMLKFKDKCVRILYPSLLLVLMECPEGRIERFTYWQVEPRGHTYGRLIGKYQHSDGRVDTWCIQQVTNVLGSHKGEQMPQGGDCAQDERFTVWEFTHRFNFKV